MGAIGGDELMQWETMQEGSRGIGIAADDSGGGNGGKDERILVSVRLRPLSEKEIMNRDSCDWECTNETTVIFRSNLPERSMLPVAYTFDRVFDCDSTTRQVYEEAAKDIALSVVSGINSSIFAYGQTSSGKTYTMSGITEYSVADIYDYVERHQERAFVLKFSALEIYNEAVRDLLSADCTPLRLLDDPERGTIVEKLTEETLRGWSHMKELLSTCEAQRQIGETSLNETSSRSHQILRLTIESSARELSSKDKLSTLSATVNFVDLAGSERASQAMTAGTRLKEGCHINRSLLTLGTVIRKLSKGRNGHIPYRDSKLTRILQSSLGGNARTAIICTMSPARSHIEQSRNTLLFASCAKEVVNNAHVNVVMSDKALVKQLQRELVRLENELRYTNSSSTISHAETLLKEKDNQIRKMEKEIKELMQQRDLAQSRMEDLLHSVGDDQTSIGWALCQTPISYVMGTCEENPISESSSVSHHGLDFHVTNMNSTFSNLDSDNYSEQEIQHNEPTRNQVMSPCPSINSPSFIGSLQHSGGKDVKLGSPGEYEDLCKEVRCIEMDETSTNKNGASMIQSNIMQTLSEDTDNFGEQKHCQNAKKDEYPSNNISEVKEDECPDKYEPEVTIVQEVTVCTLEEQLQNAKKMADIPVKPYFDESSPLTSSRNSILSRSRSCKPSLIHGSPSPWFLDEEQIDSTPPSRLLKDFSGRPTEGFLKSVRTLNYDSEREAPSGEGLQLSELRASITAHEANMVKDTSQDLTNLCDFIVGMKEMAQNQYQKQHGDEKSQIAEVENAADLQIERSVKDTGMDPISTPIESPSRWPFEFEKQQEEIIVLWHDCNVSLIHRTYFFLLFKGDPTDSIYLEVELRRLSFLKRMFGYEDVCKTMAVDDCMGTPTTSKKALRREREMLSRRMQKILSSKEREAIYLEWGIALGSKQRRLQLANLLWSKTGDTVHIRASASIIAKLVGFSEPGHEALKEMFGLSFTPQRTNRRSFSWRS